MGNESEKTPLPCELYLVRFLPIKSVFKCFLVKGKFICTFFILPKWVIRAKKWYFKILIKILKRVQDDSKFRMIKMDLLRTTQNPLSWILLHGFKLFTLFYYCKTFVHFFAATSCLRFASHYAKSAVQGDKKGDAYLHGTLPIV